VGEEATAQQLLDSARRAITAGLFLEDFVEGTPYGHLDICGPMVTGHDDGWRPTGATAFSTRLLAIFATEFRKPAR